MNTRKVLKQIKEYINETDCEIKDPDELLSELAKSVTGKNYSCNIDTLKHFNKWYIENIIPNY